MKLNPSYKNIIILMVVALGLILSWVLVEFKRAYDIIELASDPALSIKQGNLDAVSDFESGNFYFKQAYINNQWIVPGVTEEEIERDFRKHDPRGAFWCGTGRFSYAKEFAFKIWKYRDNNKYAVAYNLKLYSLLHKNTSIGN